MDEEMMVKKEKIFDLLMEVDDDLLRYFDVDSDKLLDEKIEVLNDLKSGKQIIDIPNYYDVFELLPKEGIWD